MNQIAEKLTVIAQRPANQTERKQAAIFNLIDRINYFEKSGDQEKLNECVGEANLWGARA